MKHIINNPEETIELLRNAGFEVRLKGEGIEVSLQNRKLGQMEVARVLNCESDDLGITANGVQVI